MNNVNLKAYKICRTTFSAVQQQLHNLSSRTVMERAKAILGLVAGELDCKAPMGR